MSNTASEAAILWRVVLSVAIVHIDHYELAR